MQSYGLTETWDVHVRDEAPIRSASRSGSTRAVTSRWRTSPTTSILSTIAPVGTATLAALAPRSSRRPLIGGDVVRLHDQATRLFTKVW